jgi:hypothetical protein
MFLSRVEYPALITVIGARALPERTRGTAEAVFRVFDELPRVYGKDEFIIKYADTEGGE